MPAVRLRAGCEEGASALPPSVLQFLTLKTGPQSLLAELQTFLSKKLRLPPDSQSLVFSTYHTLFPLPAPLSLKNAPTSFGSMVT